MVLKHAALLPLCAVDAPCERTQHLPANPVRQQTWWRWRLLEPGRQWTWSLRGRRWCASGQLACWQGLAVSGGSSDGRGILLGRCVSLWRVPRWCGTGFVSSVVGGGHVQLACWCRKPHMPSGVGSPRRRLALPDPLAQANQHGCPAQVTLMRHFLASHPLSRVPRSCAAWPALCCCTLEWGSWCPEAVRAHSHHHKARAPR